MGLEDLRDHVIQPGGPLVQRALLLQGDLKVLLQTLHHALVTLTHPGSLLLSDTTTRLGQETKHSRGEPRRGTPLEGLTWTLAKSTLLRSESIWFIWEVFWRTARAAWARWFRLVYRLRVWAKALTTATCSPPGAEHSQSSCARLISFHLLNNKTTELKSVSNRKRHSGLENCLRGLPWCEQSLVGSCSWRLSASPPDSLQSFGWPEWECLKRQSRIIALNLKNKETSGRLLNTASTGSNQSFIDFSQ